MIWRAQFFGLLGRKETTTKLFRLAEYRYGCYHPTGRISINEKDVAAVELLVNEPQNMLGGPWNMSRVTLSNGLVFMLNAVPDDFIDP